MEYEYSDHGDTLTDSVHFNICTERSHARLMHGYAVGGRRSTGRLVRQKTTSETVDQLAELKKLQK